MKHLFSDLAKRSEGEATAELRFRHKSGVWRWVEGIASNLLREPGVHAIVVNYRDITERKRAEEALRKSEERFQLVTRATNDAIWDWDLVTEVISWGGSFKTMFGYKPEQVVPRFEWWRSRLHPEDRNRVCMGLQSVIDHGEQFWSDEYRFCQGDGSYATILDRGYIVHDGQGKPIRMIGAMMDITDLKRAEEAIQAMNEALREKNVRIEEASRARTRFFSYMSHELKTPINSIVGFAQLLRNGNYGALAPEQTSAVGRINNNARELIHLINNILDLAKLETGKVGLQAVEVNLRELVDKVLLSFEPLLQEKGLRFRKEIDPDFPERFLTDPMQIRSILMNLFSNAVKFTERGEVRLRLERPTQGGMLLQVSDTGAGISEEYLGRIFEEYEQRGVAREAKGNYTGGSGLGLAIVKKMVDLLGGRIEVASAPGEGAVFTVFIPEASTAT
jgi:PAS domain S-box-containing protein